MRLAKKYWELSYDISRVLKTVSGWQNPIRRDERSSASFISYNERFADVRWNRRWTRLLVWFIKVVLEWGGYVHPYQHEDNRESLDDQHGNEEDAAGQGYILVGISMSGETLCCKKRRDTFKYKHCLWKLPCMPSQALKFPFKLTTIFCYQSKYMLKYFYKAVSMLLKIIGLHKKKFEYSFTL